jgi:hypothetical protein
MKYFKTNNGTLYMKGEKGKWLYFYDNRFQEFFATPQEECLTEVSEDEFYDMYFLEKI